MASGNTLDWLFPEGSRPPASNAAAIDTRGDGLTVLDFDDTTAEGAYFGSGMPSNYGGSGVTVDVYTMASSATSGDFVLELSAERGNENNVDADSPSFGTVSTATGTTNAASGKRSKTTLTISHANLGSPAAGDPMRFFLRRLPADGSDTMAGDLEFVQAHIKET